MRWLIVVACMALSGCCWLSKRSCFPACPPPRLVAVEKNCALPPPVTLPGYRRFTAGCPKETACYDKSNAAKLASRLAKMRGWISEAKDRCGHPTSRPTSLPVD